MLADELGQALREAGPIALKTFRGTIRSWTKGHDSPVSEADIAVDNFLHERLSRDGYGWLSEESKDDRSRLSSGAAVHRRSHRRTHAPISPAYRTGRSSPP